MANWLVSGVMLLKGLPKDAPMVIDPISHVFFNMLSEEPQHLNISDLIDNDLAFGFIAGATLSTVRNVLSNVKKDVYVKILSLVFQRIFYGHEKLYEIDNIVKEKMLFFEENGTSFFQRAFQLGERYFSNFPNEYQEEFISINFSEMMAGNIVALTIMELS